MWRDAGYAFGVNGISMDILGAQSSSYLTAFLVMASGTVVASMMRETKPETYKRQYHFPGLIF